MRRRASAALALALITLAGCGGDDVVERPAHRPNSVVYVTGDPQGPWAQRTEGLADGVKLAIAERDGLIGERAASIAVVPTQQRDGDQISAAIGAERIVRDSRTLAVLSTYSAEELTLAAPQLNGAELVLVQYGSGMRGLTAPDRPGEPARYEPSGERLAVRGVPSDDAVGRRIAALPGMPGARVVVAGGDGADAARLAGSIARAVGGTTGSRAAGAAPLVVVTGGDGGEAAPSAAARAAVAGASGPVVVVDAFDRAIPRSVLGGRSGRGWTVTRRLADPETAEAKAIRAREREVFGRDRGDAVVAGYLAARRILSLAAAGPERTIDRRRYAEQLAAAAPRDTGLPTDARGDSQLGSVVVTPAP